MALAVGVILNLLIFGFASAAENEDIKSINLEFVQTRILDTDYNIKLKERAVDKAFNSYRNVESSLYSVLQKSYGTQTNDSYELEQSGNLLRVATETAQTDVDVAKVKAKLTAQQKYYDLLKYQKQYYIALDKLKYAQENYRLASVKYKVGTVSRVDVINANIQLTGAKVSADVAKRKYEVSTYSFKKLLGIDNKTSLTLSEVLTYQPYTSIDVLAEMNDLVDDSNDMKSLIKLMDAYRDNVKFGKDNGLTDTTAYDDAVNALEEKDLTYNQSKDNLENAIYGAYVTLQSSADQIEVLNNQQELAFESLRIAKIQYKTGMITNNQVTSALNSYTDVLNQRSEAIYTYNVNKAKFENKLYSDMVSGS